MSGHLESEIELVFDQDDQRAVTVLRKRRAGGLCHVGKPYWDGEVLNLQLVNPTAGVFAGDRLQMKVAVEEGAKVALVTPSATRFHAMAGQEATIVQEFSVGKRAWLEYWPEWVMPQGGSEVHQITRLDVARDGVLVFGDMLAPGRVAHGESQAFRKLTTEFELRVGGQLVARERMNLEPEKGAWPLAVEEWENCFYGGLWIVGGEGDFLEEMEALSDNEIKVGFSRLSPEVVVLRMVTARSVLLRTLFERLRETISEEMRLSIPDPRVRLR
ncbi:MAG: urease accessory protein UreD [Roseibacillus sp.]